MRVAQVERSHSSADIIACTAAFLGVALLVGCAGAGASSVPGAQPQSHAAKSAQVTFTMHWNSATTASSARPKFISPSALSVSVNVNGGTPAYLNAPATTLAIIAPVGNDTFVFQTYDETNGQGNVLGRASVTEIIVDGAANVVSAVINGVTASLTIALGSPTTAAGTAATMPINVSALDADGNVIVGPGYYASPISLAIDDAANSGTLSLSTTSLPGPIAVGAKGGTPTLHYNGGTLVSASVVASTAGVPNASATITPTPTFYQFSIPTANSFPGFITAGPDGNMWFTDSGANSVSRITSSGVVTAFTVPTVEAELQGIISASDGRLWFAEYMSDKIGAMTTAGAFVEYSVSADSPELLLDRGDGTIWAGGDGGNELDVMQMCCGTYSTVPIPTANSGPFGIAAAPDNNIYFTEYFTSKVGRVSNVGSAVSEIYLTPGSYPTQMVLGPDGNLWFPESETNKIARLSTTSFSVTGEFSTLTPNATPIGIVVGGDGALWFTESTADKIGRITTGGLVTEYTSPLKGLGIFGIAVAPNGSLWFTERNVSKIGELIY